AAFQRHQRGGRVQVVARGLPRRGHLPDDHQLQLARRNAARRNRSQAQKGPSVTHPSHDHRRRTISDVHRRQPQTPRPTRTVTTPPPYLPPPPPPPPRCSSSSTSPRRC